MSIRFLTAGESHGKALIGIIEGLPAGIPLSEAELKEHMLARKVGYGRGSRQKIETDDVQIISGVRFGKTLGSPISLMIINKDFENWSEIMAAFGEENSLKKVDIPRPGHGDIVGGMKYKYSDLRNALERASARETAMRVALGYFAKCFLIECGVEIASRVIAIGSIENRNEPCEWKEMKSRVAASEVRCDCPDKTLKMITEIDLAKKNQDTLGGEFEVFAKGLPIGLGSYSQWDRKLEAKIGSSFLSLNGIKSVEMGMGRELSRKFGSDCHDEMSWSSGLKFKTNKAGGSLAGVSTGEIIIVRAAMKPIATLMKPLSSFSWSTKEPAPAHVERSDYCATPAASVIGESLLALELAGLMLEKFGGDSLAEIKPRVSQWREESKI